MGKNSKKIKVAEKSEDEMEVTDYVDEELGNNSELDPAQLQTEDEHSKLIQEAQDKYLRAIAETDNLKKRFAKERSDLIKYAGEYLAQDLLEVVDNLERALNSISSKEDNEFIKGVRLIHAQLEAVLDKQSIRPETAIGTKFDPNKHQAMTTMESSEYEPGTVVQELKKAYFFKDKLLRPAQVVVAKAPESEAEN